MFQYIATAIIAFLSAFIAGKLIQKSIARDIESMVFNYLETSKGWLRSTEGAEFIASIGQLFGAGLIGSLKNIQPKGGVTKIFGFKVPNEVVSAIISKYFKIPLTESETPKYPFEP